MGKQAGSSDGYLAVPVDILGTEYYAVTYLDSILQSEVMVVGVEDETTVTFRFPANMKYPVNWNGQFYGAGSTLTGTVNRFDTWQLVSKGDLTGTYISSNKKVSVISGNKLARIKGPFGDHLCEMMVPVITWGKGFISVPIPERTVGDIFRFIASEAGTKITISCGRTETIILANAGDFVEKHIDSSSYCSIKSNKAVMVVQFVLSQQSNADLGDPSMMIIPPIEQFAADYTFATPKYFQPPKTYNNFFMFVIRDDDKYGLKIDETPFPASTIYHQVVHDGVKYAAGYIKVSEGPHTVRHDIPTKVFGAFLYGSATFETYAFPIGARLAPINTQCIPKPTEIGDGLDNDCDGLIDEEACWDSNQDDDGDKRQNEDCATPPPVDGKWADWNEWGACSVTCSSMTGSSVSGSRSRDRTCTNPAPEYDGKQCVGQASENEACSVTDVFCPANTNTKSCKEILDLYPSTQRKDGVYYISFGCHKKAVFCDMTTDGGGWTVIQKRQDGRNDFFKSWIDYKKGFGSARFDYWIGNDVIHSLTSEMDHELLIELLSFDCKESYARYSSFRVGDELTVLGYSGTAGNNFRHKRIKFSTFDHGSRNNCARKRHGAWWYMNCRDSGLNGKYGKSAKIGLSYMTWWTWRKKPVALKRSVMKIRPYA